MKEKQLMKGGSFYAASSNCHPARTCPTENKCRRAIPAFPVERHEPGFSGPQHTYFFADSLVSFDTSTGKGTVQWKRQQLMPRQAFNANTYLHQPLQSLDFPETAYDNNPQLTFTVEPVTERTLRIHMLTRPSYQERRCR